MNNIGESIDLGGRYSRVGSKVYFSQWSKTSKNGRQNEVVMGADADSFTVIKWEYAKDSQSVFFYGKKIQTADPKTFCVLDDVPEAEKNRLAKDNKHVFWNGEVIPHADPQTFTVLDSSYYKDAQAVFFLKTALVNADSSSFHVLTVAFAKDATNVYFLGRRLPGADSATFEHLNNGYARDKFHIYFNDKVIGNVSDGNLVILGKNGVYAKNNKFVFFTDNVIKDADPKSFYIINEKEKFSADKNSEYWQSSIIDENGYVDIKQYSLHNGQKPELKKMKVVNRTLISVLFKKIKGLLK